MNSRKVCLDYFFFYFQPLLTNKNIQRWQRNVSHVLGTTEKKRRKKGGKKKKKKTCMKKTSLLSFRLCSTRQFQALLLNKNGKQKPRLKLCPEIISRNNIITQKLIA